MCRRNICHNFKVDCSVADIKHAMICKAMFFHKGDCDSIPWPLCTFEKYLLDKSQWMTQIKEHTTCTQWFLCSSFVLRFICFDTTDPKMKSEKIFRLHQSSWHFFCHLVCGGTLWAIYWVTRTRSNTKLHHRHASWVRTVLRRNQCWINDHVQTLFSVKSNGQQCLAQKNILFCRNGGSINY